MVLQVSPPPGLQAQGEIQGLATELERLEIRYKSGRADAEAEYEHRVDDVVKDVCEKQYNTIQCWAHTTSRQRKRLPPTIQVQTNQVIRTLLINIPERSGLFKTLRYYARRNKISSKFNYTRVIIVRRRSGEYTS